MLRDTGEASHCPMTDRCTKCDGEVPLDRRECPVCSQPAGFPNVRMAERPNEVAALDRRVAAARASAAIQGLGAELDALARAVTGSKAVMNKRLAALHSWVSDSNPLLNSFYRQVDAGRQHDRSAWDEQRSAAEAAINPYCYRELVYAALTLDDKGLTYFGEYSVLLKELTIEDRASVFEENPFLFNRRHGVVAGSSPPRGYRGPWNRRADLAIAKLHSKLVHGMSEPEFADLLMERRQSRSGDFVEVHIYGPVNRLGVEKVTGSKPPRRADRALWSQTARALKDLGAVVEESG